MADTNHHPYRWQLASDETGVSGWNDLYHSEVQPDCIYITDPGFMSSNTFPNDIRSLKALYSCSIQKFKKNKQLGLDKLRIVHIIYYI